MKSSNSQLLKAMKASYFNNINSNNDSHPGTYSKTKDRLSMLEFELERNREIIIQLRTELAAKNKEISLLKVNNNKKNEEYHKAMRVIEEILKQCDQSTAAGYTAIENSVLNSDLNNNVNDNITEKNNSISCKNKNKKYVTNLPQIGSMLHFSTKHKKAMKEIVYVSKLKSQINNLNDELVKKDEKISELKKNQNATNYTKLQNNFIKNYNELTQVKKENEFMKTRIEDVHHLLMAEKEDNINLKSKLLDFQDKYHYYKDNTTKKTNALENMLAKMRTRVRECKIFHVRKGTSAMAVRSRKGDLGQSSDENYEDEFENNDTNKNNKEINANDIKRMSRTMDQLKISQNNKENQIRALKKEKKDLMEEIKQKENDKDQLNQKIQALNKQIQEGNLKRKNLDKIIKEQAIDANKKIENLEKENKELSEFTKQLQNSLNEKESLLEEEKSRTNAMKELLKEQEDENKKLNKKIEQLEKKIEELQNELINYKDDMFLTNVGIKKTPHKENKNIEKINEDIKEEEKEEKEEKKEKEEKEEKEENNINKKNENEDLKDLSDIYKEKSNEKNKEQNENKNEENKLNEEPLIDKNIIENEVNNQNELQENKEENIKEQNNIEEKKSNLSDKSLKFLRNILEYPSDSEQIKYDLNENDKKMENKNIISSITTELISPQNNNNLKDSNIINIKYEDNLNDNNEKNIEEDNLNNNPINEIAKKDELIKEEEKEKINEENNSQKDGDNLYNINAINKNEENNEFKDPKKEEINNKSQEEMKEIVNQEDEYKFDENNEISENKSPDKNWELNDSFNVNPQEENIEQNENHEEKKDEIFNNNDEPNFDDI